MAQQSQLPGVAHQFRTKLMGFIRKRVKSLEDAEDILQDVFFQFAEAERLMKPIDQISAWLFTVARNKITDLYRKKKPDLLEDKRKYDELDDDMISELADFLTSSNDSPEWEYLKSVVWTELSKALGELPVEQSSVFEMNELEGLSFKEIAAITGETENTLISRKRYAVLHLRKRLQTVYTELITF